MTAEKLLKNKYKLEGNRGELRIDQIIMFMQEYAKIKCKELLEIVAEKAKVIQYSAYIDMPPEKEIRGENFVIQVDKDSVLNAVDLEDFCS